jgi:hypothetical protein
MRSQGWQNLHHLDIEHLDAEPRILSEPFDLLLLTEVLEHLNNPGRFLEAIQPLFRPHTELLITTPNSTSLSNIIANLHHTEAVHPEHNYWFSYHTLGSMLNKYGYQIRQVALYSQYDYTQPWVNRFLPAPARINLPPDHQGQPSGIEQKNNINEYRRHKVGGWLRANAQAVLYSLTLKHWPYFADGLIAIVCLAD